MVKHKHVSAIVTTAGGIEEDFIKCLGHTYLADFNLDGAELRKKGMNRIGNLVVPNDNYCKFEDWLTPILDAMLKEQKETGEVWSPSSVIRRLGKEINNEDSVYYWAYKVKSIAFVFYNMFNNDVERHPSLLSCVDRWILGRHDLFPLIPFARLNYRHCQGHTSPQ